MRRLVLCLALGLFGASPALGQDVAGAEAVARAYTEAIAAGDWAAAAALTDPDDLARLGELVGFLVQIDPGEAAAVGLDADSTPEDLFVFMMEAVVGADPMMADAMESVRLDVIGTVIEGDSLAHVVGRTRLAVFGREVAAVDVSTVRWTGERWVMGLDDQLEAALAGMEAFREDPDLFEADATIMVDEGPPRDPKKRQ